MPSAANDVEVLRRAGGPLPHGTLQWPSNSTISPAGPTGKFKGPSLWMATASREDVLSARPVPNPSSDHYFVQVKDVSAYNYVPRTTNVRNRVHNFTGQALKFSERGQLRPFRRQKQLEQARGLVCIKGADQEGRSVSIIVHNQNSPAEQVPFYVTVNNESVLKHTKVVNDMLRKAEKGVGARNGCLHWEVLKRCLSYGLRLDPIDPRKRRVYSVIRVTAPTPLVRDEVAKYLIRRGVGVEEWTLSPSFAFHDVKHVPPEGWIIIPKGTYKLRDRSDRYTDRHIEVDVESRHITGLEHYREQMAQQLHTQLRPACASENECATEVSSRLNQHLRGAPSEEDTAPSLVVSFDAEMRSSDPKRRCDEHCPEDEITTISMAFYWVGSVPPSMRRVSEEESQARFREQEAIVRRVMDEARRERVADAETKLEKERQLRAARQAAMRDPNSMYRPIERMSTLEDNDIVPDDAVLQKVHGSVDAMTKTHLKNAANRCQYYPWPTHTTRVSNPGEPVPYQSTKEVVQLEQVERKARSVHGRARVVSRQPRGGIRTNETFLHVTLVNTSTGGCAALDGVILEEHNTEADMMKAFRNWLAFMQVDGIRGYNINGFDLPYMFVRAQFHEVERMVFQLTPVLDDTLFIRSYKTKTGKVKHNVNGFGAVDLYDFVLNTLSLDSNKLQRVAEEYGLLGKHDVEYTHVNHAHPGPVAKPGASASDRRRLKEMHEQWKGVVAGYCAQDANLCVEIADKMMAEIGWIEFAKVMKTPTEQLWSAGQQVRVVNQLAWKAHRGENGKLFILNDLRFNLRNEPDVMKRIRERRRNFMLGRSGEGGIPCPPPGREDRSVGREDGSQSQVHKRRRVPDEKDTARNTSAIGGGHQRAARNQTEQEIRDVFNAALAEKDPDFAKARADTGWSPPEADGSAKQSMRSEDAEDAKDAAAATMGERAEKIADQEGISYDDALKRLEKQQKSYSGGAVLPAVRGFYRDHADAYVAYDTSDVTALDRMADGRFQLTLKSGETKTVDERYSGCVATQDFMSLYPSAQMSYNLCYSTFLTGDLNTKQGIARLRELGHDVRVFDMLPEQNESRVYAFVKNIESLLPSLLKSLWDLRQGIKKEMKKIAGSDTPDWGRWEVLNAKQKAIKVSMNSFYGSTGAKEYQGAKYPCLPVAETTTFLGRYHVLEARDVAEEFREPGLLDHAPCVVVYGDTDSIMCRTPFPPQSWLRIHRLTAWFKREHGVADKEARTLAQKVVLDGSTEVRSKAQRDLPHVSPPIWNEVSQLRFTREERIRHVWDVNDRLCEVLNQSYRQRGLMQLTMEFEENKERFLLQQKKMYAYVGHEKLSDALNDLSPPIEIKGLAAKKRDRSRVEAHSQKKVLEALVREQDEEKAWRITKDTLLRIARGLFNIEDFVVSKRINNKYAPMKQIPDSHVSVAWDKEKKAPGMEPGSGAYVHYWLSAVADPERATPPTSVWNHYVLCVLDADSRRRRGNGGSGTASSTGRNQAPNGQRDLRSLFRPQKAPQTKTQSGRKVITPQERAEHIVRDQIKRNKQAGVKKKVQGLLARSAEENGKPNAVEYIRRTKQPLAVAMHCTSYAAQFDQLVAVCEEIASEYVLTAVEEHENKGGPRKSATLSAWVRRTTGKERSHTNLDATPDAQRAVNDRFEAAKRSSYEREMDALYKSTGSRGKAGISRKRARKMPAK